MIWILMSALAVAVIAPVVLFAWKGAALRGRREQALALHRAQLVELDRDLTEGRLVPEEHAAATLEVQRRLLADAALADGEARRGGVMPLALVTMLVPAAAFGLYLIGGNPDFPPKDSAEPAPQSLSDQERAKRDEELITQLRARLRLMDVGSPKWIEGYTILGQAELSRGHMPEASEAWKLVLAHQFDPGLAVEEGEILTEEAGIITPEAATYFKRAALESPPDSPWSRLLKKRMSEIAKAEAEAKAKAK